MIVATETNIVDMSNPSGNSSMLCVLCVARAFHYGFHAGLETQFNSMQLILYL